MENVRLVTSNKYTGKEYFFETDSVTKLQQTFLKHNLMICILKSNYKYLSSCDLSGLF